MKGVIVFMLDETFTKTIANMSSEDLKFAIMAIENEQEERKRNDRKLCNALLENTFDICVWDDNKDEPDFVTCDFVGMLKTLADNNMLEIIHKEDLYRYRICANNISSDGNKFSIVLED